MRTIFFGLKKEEKRLTDRQTRQSELNSRKTRRNRQCLCSTQEHLRNISITLNFVEVASQKKALPYYSHK